MDFTVSDLRDQPQFFDTVADRIWQAWSQYEGLAFDAYVASLRELLDREALPFALVAHRGDVYLGSALGVASDLDLRPHYTPWVASVWVEPEHRRLHVGQTLVAHIRDALFALGHRRVYLFSVPELRDFYMRQRWQPIEENVGSKALIIYARDAP